MEQRPETWAAGGLVEVEDLRSAIPIILAIAIAAAFVGALLNIIDFPLGTHADEVRKVSTILQGGNSYSHPILMLQLARAAKAFAGVSDPQALVELGRGCAVVAGGVAVFASFLLARKMLPIPAALAATLAVAVVPLTTVHARYFKEDIFALPFVVLSLVALINTLKSPTIARGVLLGGTIGLAAAAKYVAAITLPFAIIVLLLSSSDAAGGLSRRRIAGLTAIIAIALFALVHLSVLFEFDQFLAAAIFNLKHAGHGHDVRVPVALTYGLFHLSHSLLPSLGLPLLVLGLLGLVSPWLAPSERRQPLLIIAAFAMLWYAVHELSPLKPFPGFVRYVLPLAPLLIILGAAFVCELMRRRSGLTKGTVAAAIVVAAAAPALYSSFLINGPVRDDPRSIVSATVLGNEPQTTFDSYTRFYRPAGQASTRVRPRAAAPPSTFVSSSFVYDRFAQFGFGPEQPERTRASARYYTALFRRPYLEVTSGRPSYAFFNPVIRIVALEGNGDRLAPIAAALRRRTPNLSIRFVNTEP